MTLYILTAYWRDEGHGTVLGVFSSESIALEWLAKTKFHKKDYVELTKESLDNPLASCAEEPAREVWSKS